jgi:hypothetical protein
MRENKIKGLCMGSGKKKIMKNNKTQKHELKPDEIHN